MSLKDPKNQKILNDFMAEHAPLIHKQVNILKSKGKVHADIDESDLHFHGFHGLMDALHKYDPEIAQKLSPNEKNPFIKYAEQRIKGKMLDHITSTGDVPKAWRTRVKNLEALKQGKTQTSEETPEVPKTPKEPT